MSGTLGLTTPWARAAFGANDRAVIEALIPDGWTIGVSVTSDYARVILWLLDPQGTERLRWTEYSRASAVWATREMAVRACGFLRPPEATYEHEGFVVEPLESGGAA